MMRLIQLTSALLMSGLSLGCHSSAPQSKPPEHYDIARDNQATGRTYIFKMQHGPFPSRDKASGYQHKDRFYAAEKHYQDDRTVIFAPHHYQRRRQVHLVFFFHGWYNSPEKAFKVYQVGEQFAASAKNGLLVVPAGPRYAPDSSGGKLSQHGGFKRYLSELKDRLLQAGLITPHPDIRIVLTGHSGGYRVMADILADPQRPPGIREVYLFDGLYNRHTDFETWIASGRGRFISLFTNVGGTAYKTRRMVKRLQKKRVALLFKHADQASLPELSRRRVLFLESAQDHRAVLNGARQLTLLLATGRLPDVSLTGAPPSPH